MTKRTSPCSSEVRAAQFGWFWSTRASTARNGPRSSRSRRISDARARRCAIGCARANAIVVRGPDLTSEERKLIKSLERQVRELCQAKEILRKASAYFAQAELNRPFKRWRHLLTRTVRFTRSSRFCRVLPIAPSTYHNHAAKQAIPAEHRPANDVTPSFAENFGVYGVRKVWRQMKHESFDIARCTVTRLMRKMGLMGVVRGKAVRTTISDILAPSPLDRVWRSRGSRSWRDYRSSQPLMQPGLRG
jgi:transposase-like protein